VSREEFKDWLSGLNEDQQTTVLSAMAEALYEDHMADSTPATEIRQHIYDIFPDWHEENE